MMKIRKLLLALSTVLVLGSNAAYADDETNAEPVTLINAFVVPAGKEDEAGKFWQNAADFMKTQPGYISTALHQAILPDAKFHLVNVAKWESAEAYQNASKARRAQSNAKPPEGVIPYPSLYEIIIED